MEELTKEQRHDIYVKTLSIAKKDTSPYSLCLWLIDAMNIHTYDLDMDEFPEIIKHKPSSYSLYWFDPEDKKTRIKIVKQAIEETK